MTVVINGAEIENLAPKRPKTLTVQSCKICKDLRADKLAPSAEPQGPTSNVPSNSSPPTSPFEGNWSGSMSWLFLRYDVSYNLTMTNGRVSGTSTANRTTITIRDGVIAVTR